MDVGLLIKLVGGLFLLVAGVRQAVRTPLVRRGGVRSTGSVVRVQREWDARENVWMYAPVVAFRDEQGAGREFTTTTMTTWAAHEPGQEVTVLHPPGRPELARLKSGAHDALWFVAAGLSVLFILVGLALLGSAAAELLSGT